MTTVQDMPQRHLELEGELTIYRAAELRTSIRHAISGATALTLGLGAVTEIDSAGAQLLIAARRTARETGCMLTLAGHSEAVLDALGVLGLVDALGVSSAAAQVADMAVAADKE